MTAPLRSSGLPTRQRVADPPLRVIPGGVEAALRHRRSAAVYRRRRVVVSLLAAALLLVVISVAGALEGALLPSVEEPAVGGSEAVAPAGVPAVAVGLDGTAAVHVVAPGDTLWSIARDLQPHGDVRPLVDRLVSLNGGTELRVGQRLDLRGLSD